MTVGGHVCSRTALTCAVSGTATDCLVTVARSADSDDDTEEPRPKEAHSVPALRSAILHGSMLFGICTCLFLPFMSGVTEASTPNVPSFTEPAFPLPKDCSSRLAMSSATRKPMANRRSASCRGQPMRPYRITSFEVYEACDLAVLTCEYLRHLPPIRPDFDRPLVFWPRHPQWAFLSRWMPSMSA